MCEGSFHSQLHNSPFIAGLQGLQRKQSRHVACLQLAAKMTFYNQPWISRLHGLLIIDNYGRYSPNCDNLMLKWHPSIKQLFGVGSFNRDPVQPSLAKWTQLTRTVWGWVETCNQNPWDGNSSSIQQRYAVGYMLHFILGHFVPVEDVQGWCGRVWFL